MDKYIKQSDVILLIRHAIESTYEDDLAHIPEYGTNIQIKEDNFNT